MTAVNSNAHMNEAVQNINNINLFIIVLLIIEACV